MIRPSRQIDLLQTRGFRMKQNYRFQATSVREEMVCH